MSNVTFDEPVVASSQSERPVTGIAGALVRSKIVATEGQATFLIAALALIMIAGAIYIFATGMPKDRVPTPEELKAIQEMEQGTRAR